MYNVSLNIENVTTKKKKIEGEQRPTPPPKEPTHKYQEKKNPLLMTHTIKRMDQTNYTKEIKHINQEKHQKLWSKTPKQVSQRITRS